MIRAISTYVYVKERLHPGLLDSLVRAGAEAIEIFCARGHFDYTDKQHVREISNWFKGSGVTFNSLHSPMYSDYEWGRTGTPPVNLADKDKLRRIYSMDEVKRALEVAEQIPFRFLIQHMGTPGEEFDSQKFEDGMSSLDHLHAFAKPLGVKLLLENIPNEIATPERLMEFLHVLHYEDLGLCFDLGHANVMSSVPQAFAIMKAHIRSTHVHDNPKDRDTHLWPGEGSIDWDEAMSLLRSAPHVPPVLMEINGEGQVNVVEKYVETFRMLESAASAAAQN